MSTPMNAERYYLFLDSRPSPARQRLAWDDPRRGAPALRAALADLALQAHQYSFRSLCCPDGQQDAETLSLLHAWHSPTCRVVTLGLPVHRALQAEGVPHLSLPMPPATGNRRYTARVACVLSAA